MKMLMYENQQKPEEPNENVNVRKPTEAGAGIGAML